MQKSMFAVQILLQYGSLEIVGSEIHVDKDTKLITIENARVVSTTHYKADALLEYSIVSNGSLEIPNAKHVRTLVWKSSYNE